VHPDWGNAQILSTYVLDKVLKPGLPDDACVLLALTAADLWPGSFPRDKEPVKNVM
jgi:hypothetical protein